MSHRFVVRAALAVAASLSALTVHAQLGFEQALQAAEQRSAQLVAQGSAAAAAREMAVAAGQRPDPMLTGGVQNLPIDGPDRFSLGRDFMTMRSIGLMQQYTRKDKLEARATRFEHEARLAEAGRDVALAALRTGAAAAWLSLYWNERLRERLVAHRDEARLQIDAAEAAQRGGRGPQADVFAARSAVAQIEDLIEQALAQVENARTTLARWVGEDAARQPLGAPPPMDAVRLDLAGIDREWAHHPQIALLAKQEDVARAEAALARANLRSDWNAEVMVSKRGSQFSNMLSLNFSIPLQLDQANRQQRELASSLAKVEQLRAEREETTRAHLADARAMLQEWQSQRERLRRYDESLTPLAAQRTQAALAAYRGANGAALGDVLAARRAEIETALERTRLEMQTARLWSQLEYLIPEGDHR